MHVLVHGGAGGVPDDPAPRQAVLDDAAEAGVTAETPLDAVEAAVRTLEESPRFNAGLGSCVQSDGIARTDAGVMTGDRDAGAVCGMPGVETAISVARGVLEETPHVLLSGVHAVDFAAELGIDTEVDLLTETTRERFESSNVPEGGLGDQLDWVQSTFGGAVADPESATESDEKLDTRDHDTVGAVATDGDCVAAATSTGGRWLALAGRVGDVPQIGSGFYAGPAGGASATGAGEDIARVTLSRRAVRHLESGMDASEAANRAIEEFGELTGASAGVIVADVDGTLGSAYNSEGMQTTTLSACTDAR
jgi:beta-aspartyl-peptidase (threonine type)